jgi:hypothetical protein
MSVPTYTPLATVILGSSASSVTFNNIPNTYRDLILVWNFIGSSSGFSDFLPNNDTAGNKSIVYMSGQGNSAVSSSSSNNGAFYTGVVNTSIRTSGIAHIMDYSTTDKHKAVMSRWGHEMGISSSQLWALAGRWPSTASINQIICRGNYASGSTFNLYGVIA